LLGEKRVLIYRRGDYPRQVRTGFGSSGSEAGDVIEIEIDLMASIFLGGPCLQRSAPGDVP
jgi:hypothetical protein